MLMVEHRNVTSLRTADGEPLAAAVAAFLAEIDLAPSSRRVYTLTQDWTKRNPESRETRAIRSCLESWVALHSRMACFDFSEL